MRRSRDFDRLHAALAQARVPGEGAAEDRSWVVVRSAFAARDPLPRAPGRVRRFTAAAATAAIAAAIALTPAGADVRDWLADAISPGAEDARPVLGSLPAPGSILVEAGGGVWVQREDGGRRLLGEYDRATWSPRGLYVAAARDRELVALTPAGDVRWTLVAPAAIRALDWSSDEGYRVAYVAGDQLRVVAGDGTGDVLVRPRVGAPAIAWRPESSVLEARHELAFVDPRNRVTLLDTDSGQTLWRSPRYGSAPHSLEWSADGTRLLVGAEGFASILASDGSPVVKGVASAAAAPRLSPDGRSVAVVREGRSGRVELALVPIAPAVRESILYRAPAGAGGTLGPPTFSPGGEWILLPWPAADQWLFVNASTERVIAIAGVADQFDPDRRGPAPVPRSAGWCC